MNRLENKLRSLGINEIYIQLAMSPLLSGSSDVVDKWSVYETLDKLGYLVDTSMRDELLAFMRRSDLRVVGGN